MPVFLRCALFHPTLFLSHWLSQRWAAQTVFYNHHFRKSHCRCLVVTLTFVPAHTKCFDTKKICVHFVTTIYCTRTQRPLQIYVSVKLTEPRGWYHIHLEILRLGVENCAHSPHGRKKSSSAKFSAMPECCVTPLTTKQTTYTCLKSNVSAAVCFCLVVEMWSR